MKENLDVFAARLRQLRIEKDWRQGDLAEQTGLGQSQICRFEKGDQAPTWDSLLLLSEALDCTVDYLVCKNAPRQRLTREEVDRWKLVETCLSMEASETFLLHLLTVVATKLFHKPVSKSREGALRMVQALIAEELET